MPSPRALGGTKMRRAEEYTTSLPMVISPTRGRSRPAIERSVVVLPQPLGPRRVKNLPCGTSNATSCAARIAWPRSPTYSVHSPVTVSKLELPDSEATPDPLGEQHQHEERQDQHHAERGELDVLAVLPEFPDDEGDHFRAWAVEQDGARQFPDGNDHDVDPAGNEAGLEQRQDDAPEGRGPRGAAHRGGFLELLVNLEHRSGVVA